MPKRKYIKRSPDGRYFLYIENIPEEIDMDKKTKLWLSSNYLFTESIKEDPKITKDILNHLIKWNVKKEKYEECEKLKILLQNINEK